MNRNKFNGERLKSARTYRGLTISELAKEINVTKQAISLYEKNKVIPEPENFFKIINYLKFPKEYFFQQSTTLKTTTTYFRALLNTNKKNKNQQISKNEHLIEIYKVLNSYIDFPELFLPKNIDVENQSIEEIAQTLREFWNIDNQPIKNIVYLLEKNGIIVSNYYTSSKDIDAFSQLIQLTNEDKYVIALSLDKISTTRTQFNAAHELGHILLHPWSEDIDTLTKEEFKEREKQANAFAAAFLLPKNSFIKDLIYPTNLNYYIKLKKKWRVSISAMIIRAFNLDVISFNQYQYLMRQISKKGWKKEEPLDDTLQIIKPTLLTKSIDLLLDNEIFDTQSFIQELSNNHIALNSEEVEILLNLPKGKLAIDIDNDNNIFQLTIKTPQE